jgi:hypothetical protein
LLKQDPERARSITLAAGRANVSAAIYMALPPVIMFELVADLVAGGVGISPPIDRIDKWLYLAVVYGGAVYLIVRLFDKPDLLQVAEKQLEAGGSYAGYKGNLLMVLYYVIPGVLYLSYFFVLK